MLSHLKAPAALLSMMIRWPLCSLFALLMACGGNVQHTPLDRVDGGDLDSGPDAGTNAGPDQGVFICTLDKDGLMVPLHAGQVSGDGCNECSCVSVSTAPSGYIAACTAAGCADAGVGTPSNRRCDTSADCPSSQSFCHFDAICGERGWCGAPQSRCRGTTNPPATAQTTEPVFCGCDGVTYVGENCYSRPWMHLGPCVP